MSEHRRKFSGTKAATARAVAAGFCLAAALLACGCSKPSAQAQPQSQAPAQTKPQQPAWTAQEKPVFDQIHGLRSLSDDERARTTKQLALDIRQLPAGTNKLALADELANLSTEGDFGHDTVQEVATTLADALHESPAPEGKGQPASDYIELASLVHFEHVQVSLDDPEFAAATAKVEAEDKGREHADFTLTDIDGKSWAMKDLRGKVVLVNFWATWCPPCRKEMPDLDSLYNRFKGKGFVVLAISDEDAATVRPFIAQHQYAYPILLDPGDNVHHEFQIEGIPMSFVCNRSGKLVAESMDMRTQNQFLGMLAEAGLK